MSVLQVQQSRAADSVPDCRLHQSTHVSKNFCARPNKMARILSLPGRTVKNVCLIVEEC